ncbi:hypothetical protein BV25DRAFT_167705 [Artomyces pyxidatus]|uniref:Uncharacterized protein n=1 Tax=Artomyces pyxidatus TaxID=48021 RepID=A0ACB8SGN2_9AGAM|nr:hypothetical protein BV25DRAFT_167705 [Artomyces pyxidatus]
MNAVLLHNQRIPPTSLGTPDTLQAPTFDTDSTAAHMHILPALSSARTALHTLYLTQSTIAHDSRLLLAGLHIEKNQNSYAGFLRNCSSYGRTVVSMAVAFIQHRSFARSKSMHDRQVRGSAIMARAHPFPRTENGLAANFRGATRVFHDIDTVLRKTAQAWDVLCTQHNTVFARVLALDEPETYLGACSIKQLSHVMRMWAKEGNVLRGAAARLCT